MAHPASARIEKTEAEWRAELPPERFRVLREKGTEPPFSGEYWDAHDAGTYRCAACGAPLFHSGDKFDSGTGWPSFTRPATSTAVATVEDDSLGMRRTEIACSRCGSHLGHVFDDGPQPTGKRYCVNSLSLDLGRPQENPPSGSSKASS